MMPPASDLVTVSVTVPADPATAFAIFTKETDLWWRSGPKFRIAGKQPGVVRFEPWLGGRFMEEVESPSGPQVFTMGRITVWQPPERFQFEWQGVNFAPGESYVCSGCVRSRADGNTRHCASLGLGEAASRSSRASRQGGAVVHSHGWTLVE